MTQTTEDLCYRAIVAGEGWKERALTAETINKELLAALKAGRSFLAYAQAYDGARMTAAEVKECDKAMRLTNAAIAKAEGR